MTGDAWIGPVQERVIAVLNLVVEPKTRLEMRHGVAEVPKEVQSCPPSGALPDARRSTARGRDVQHLGRKILGDPELTADEIEHPESPQDRKLSRRAALRLAQRARSVEHFADFRRPIAFHGHESVAHEDGEGDFGARPLNGILDLLN